MLTLINIPVANGQTVVNLTGVKVGNIEISLKMQAQPSAGTLKIEGLPFGGSSYITIEGCSAINIGALSQNAVINATDYGQFSALRFTLSGVVGAAGSLIGGAYIAEGLPAGIFNGTRAINSQTYLETSAKLGMLNYIQKHIGSVAANAKYNIALNTGPQIVALKERSLYSNGVNMSLQYFKAPTGVSGGTAIPAQNYSDINPIASTVSLIGGVAVTGAGTPWGDPDYIYNASANGNGQRDASRLGPNADRILAPNSSYLLQISNNDTNAALADLHLSWYEGPLDLPRQ